MRTFLLFEEIVSSVVESGKFLLLLSELVIARQIRSKNG